MEYPGFVGPTYVGQSRIADGEIAMNFYPEVIESGRGKGKLALYPTPGLEEFTSSGTGGVRAMMYENGRMFAVIGSEFVEISSGGTITVLGVVDPGSSKGYICSNGSAGFQIAIATNGNLYIFNTVTSVFTAVPGVVADVLAYLDGFFLALDRDLSRLRISDYADGLTWDLLQFRERSSASDDWVSMIVIHREIWLMGSQTYEVWSNTGAAPFPFTPIQGVFFNQGIASSDSLVQIGESAAWLSSNNQGFGMVMLSEQYSPKRISNHSVEYSIQQYVRDGGSLSDAIGFVYQEDGHTFYVLNFIGANFTWVYDITTDMWHQRGYWNTSVNTVANFEAWRPASFVNAFGMNLVGDRALGVIYRMGIDIYTDVDGKGIRRVRRAPHVFNEKKNVAYHQFELDMQVGIGLATGQGSDPKVMLRVSDDGGYTWSNEILASAGQMGRYDWRVWWQQLGAGRDRVFEIVVSDPVPWRIINAYLELTPWRH